MPFPTTNNYRKIDFKEEVGLLKRGTIVDYDLAAGTMDIQLTTHSAIKGQHPKPVSIPLPHSMFYNNGLFIGSAPHIGSTVVIAQGNGGSHYFVSFLSEDTTIIPELDPNTIRISAGDEAKIILSLTNEITIGDDDSFIHLNTTDNIVTSNFDGSNNFTLSSRAISGEIKRDLAPNKNVSQESKLTSSIYESKLHAVGLDPSMRANSLISGPSKNPSLVESRELIYEFRQDSIILDEYNESLSYSDKSFNDTNYSFPNRRDSKTDVLSLTLLQPNYLMEIIKGTVVDVFGNILDLNRVPLPIGKGTITLNSDNVADKKAAFISIRELDRKSIAFHFEINARKDLINSTTKQLTLPDINSNDDYARVRSRFFFDIDKEGQFKLNVPASSDKGNIPLLTRYENYSSVGNEDDNNPNKLIFRQDNLDILHDSFAAPSVIPADHTFNLNSDKGSIKLVDNGADGAPQDRITLSHIKHGTVYHDILHTCYAHQTLAYLEFPNEWGNEAIAEILDIPPFPIQPSDIPLLSNVVSDAITISGDKANAGGRSGSLNFDGSIEMNIGANHIDRQSIWLDTAGGIVGNIGRDKQDNSAVLSMDGNVFMQVGAFGVTTDSRFADKNNGQIGSILDIRVMNTSGRATLIRVDQYGTASVLAPGHVIVHAGQDMRLSADGNMTLDAENIIVQGRIVNKDRCGSI